MTVNTLVAADRTASSVRLATAKTHHRLDVHVRQEEAERGETARNIAVTRDLRVE